ncbi:FAD/NAD(P)-binding domain-containing protein [Auricularia subglabra TFB-10046 SS5]|nr:FAD/NAD(P)-binding domain-containing protein [Auricularia subglabra TFB-10046 SS5]
MIAFRIALAASTAGAVVTARAGIEPNAQAPFQTTGDVPAAKRVAVVGLGAGGITALKALADLPERMRAGWEIIAFEQREAIGGLWVPDNDVPLPPALPMTPLYPSLRTNGPHPVMTLPQTPLPPETPLLATHEDVLRYYQGIVSRSDLSHYIKLQHSVNSARWIGTSQSGYWNVTVHDLRHDATKYYEFDHIIVAPGFNHFPRYPRFEGQEEWVSANRTIMHCMYYRDPTIFAGQNVVVVGAGPSGWDMARHISEHANSVHWSRDSKKERPENPVFPEVPSVPDVTRISSLDANGTVTLRDGRQLHGVDALVLATGYDVRVPFLDHLVESDERPMNRYKLSTNSRYIRPLYEHTLSLDDSYPLGALYFCGILSYNPTGMTNYAQALFAAYTIADPLLLLNREQFYDALVAREKRVEEEGLDPDTLGHKVVRGYGRFAGHWAEGSFEDLMLNFIRDRGDYAGYPGIPPGGVNYTEKWRLTGLLTGLDIVEAWYVGLAREGDAWDARWTKGRWSEADYVDLMSEIMVWWRNVKGNQTEPRTEA